MNETSGGGGLPEPRDYGPAHWFMGPIPKGSDLAAYLNQFVREKDIRSGVLGVIGVVSQARLGFFDAESGQYVITEIGDHREIASSSGNISLLEGRPSVHVHVALSDREGKSAGGHLLEGTLVHYAEFWVAGLDGPAFERGLDPATKVTGWVR